MIAIRKKIIAFSITIFLFIIILMSGCKDEPTAPVEKEKEKPKTTATIGTDGGTINTDELSITIPSGAFSEEHEVAIFDVADDSPFIFFTR